jgi:L1 cell adhesion molecule like protein
LINRSNVVKKPLKSFDACEDFLLLTVQCHIIVAAMKMLKMKSLDAIPSSQYAPDGINTWILPDGEREKLLNQITDDFVAMYVDISYNSPHDTSSNNDMVHLYAKQVLSLGCLYMEMKDAVREGDGLRVLRCYRYLLPIFNSSQRKNYSIEILNFLVQHDYSLSERQASELIWSRFINTHGRPGKNIPNDLHCEHLNRLCKTAVRGLAANKTPECITRVARAIGTISPVLENFDADNGVRTPSTAHKILSFEKDMKCIVSELLSTAVFDVCPGRYHPSFRVPRVPLHAKPEAELIDWMETHIQLS